MRTTLVAIAAAACGILLTPGPFASAAPTTGAVATIGLLEAQGFDVNVDRVGSAPLSECEVTSVRNPQEQTRLIRIDDDRKGRDRFIEVVVNRTITVSLDCSSR